MARRCNHAPYSHSLPQSGAQAEEPRGANAPLRSAFHFRRQGGVKRGVARALDTPLPVLVPRRDWLVRPHGHAPSCPFSERIGRARGRGVATTPGRGLRVASPGLPATRQEPSPPPSPSCAPPSSLRSAPAQPLPPALRAPGSAAMSAAEEVDGLGVARPHYGCEWSAGVLGVGASPGSLARARLGLSHSPNGGPARPHLGVPGAGPAPSTCLPGLDFGGGATSQRLHLFGFLLLDPA